MNEKLLGDFIRKHNVRDKVFIASKCGFDCLDGGDSSVTNSAPHIKKYIDGTIERLGFAPDLYYLHRIDPSMLIITSRHGQWNCQLIFFPDTPLEESIPALDEIRKAGKTKYIGLSECSAKTLRKANSSKYRLAPQKIPRLTLEQLPRSTRCKQNIQHSRQSTRQTT